MLCTHTHIILSYIHIGGAHSIIIIYRVYSRAYRFSHEMKYGISFIAFTPFCILYATLCDFIALDALFIWISHIHRHSSAHHTHAQNSISLSRSLSYLHIRIGIYMFASSTRWTLYYSIEFARKPFVIVSYSSSLFLWIVHWWRSFFVCSIWIFTFDTLVCPCLCCRRKYNTTTKIQVFIVWLGFVFKRFLAWKLRYTAKHNTHTHWKLNMNFARRRQ